MAAVRFARRSANFDETVAFYRDLVGLPVCATFANSYGSTGVVFGMPTTAVTFEIIEASEPVRVDSHEQLCLYFPDQEAQRAASCGPETAARIPSVLGGDRAVTYRDPDGREVVFAPFVFGVNEPAEGSASGEHWTARPA